MKKAKPMEPKRHFKAPWSPLLILVTAASSLLFLGLAAFSLVIGISEGAPILFVGALIPFGIWIFVACFHLIRGYVLSPSCLVIRRFARDICYPLADLQGIEVDPKAMRRTCPMPNGGLFSFGGPGCRNKKLGRFSAYATDFKLCVVLRFADQTVVVTPEDPEAFADAVRALSEKGNDRR